ncbi:PfkB family carbohydrate kinase [Devosia sp. YIM 151766]|uniref:PfkB family carbohydrate kinase n=1 Tax=Devosia sp. YIM 151766 TaxID=3017325 RepID=UPI00255C7BF7|nr:PfkB family carbohydrate kinase [Devosia sp. YIM 151766]WIY53216.1 PfkB family carbohydrate kinase [Devosia sp. YIM 151766]
MPNPPHIVFLGAATMDMIFSVDTLPTGPGKILPKALVQAAHGMATSAAVAAVRLGGRASLVTRIGADLMGEHFLAEITAEGVDCRHVRRFEGVPTPLSAVIVDNEGERLILPYYDSALGSDPDWIPAGFIEQADAIQVDIRWPEGAMRALTLARQAGRLAVLDADTGPSDTIIALAERATHAVFSEPAALQVSGAASIKEALPVLDRRFAGFVAVTGGASGCFWMEGEQVQQALPPPVKAVDTLAAGDVFHGAFTLAIAEGRSIRDAIVFANAAAAIKCASLGGRLGTPDRATVETLLAGR